MLQQFGAWLESTSLSLYLQRREWILILSQTIHIVCVAVVFGAAAMISLRILGVSSRGRRLSELVDTLLPWINRALVGLLLTGVEQTIGSPTRQFAAAEFRWKMLLLAVTVILTVCFARSVRARAPQWDEPAARPAGAKSFAVAWLGLWIAIIYCGRFIGYA
jgi:hypothetical protein